MNVFVLSTGRSGTTTFSKACAHITNYTSGHESKRGVFPDRLVYTANHIEIDNRLTWMLGRLDEDYGTDSFYVHLISERTRTAKSFFRRWGSKHSIIQAYTQGILFREHNEMGHCLDYYDTVHANIRCFLKDKPHQLTVNLETMTSDFPVFWKKIKAEGNLDAACAEWNIQHNSTKEELKQTSFSNNPKYWLKNKAKKILNKQ